MNMKATMAAGVFALCSAGAAPAALLDYSTDFTSSDGFSDGTSIDEIDGWLAQGTNGPAANTGSFGSFSISGNGPAYVHAGSGGSFGVGDSIELMIDVFYTNSTQNQNLRIGIKEGLSVNGPGSRAQAGIVFRNDFQGDLEVDGTAQDGSEDQPIVDSGFDAAAGQASGETVVVTITKSATEDLFDVSWSYRSGAATGAFTVTNESLYDATDVYGVIQYNGPTNSVNIDSFALDYTVVPEPATVFTAGLGSLMALLRRRRSLA
ncbi:MAG: PEP-CTERM sorting domain-containing protein [Planctomycetota bacterium]